MQNTKRHLALIVVVSVLVTSSFFAGYGAAFRSSGPSTTAAASLAAPPVPATISPELEKEFALFWEAWNIIDREFYDRKALDNKKRTYGAISGMIEALGDPHTAFATPTQSSVNEGDLKGSFDGIGVTVELLDRMVVVVAPLPDSPGEKAGIRPGDIILEANGQKINAAQDLFNMIKNLKSGEAAVLKFIRIQGRSQTSSRMIASPPIYTSITKP